MHTASYGTSTGYFQFHNYLSPRGLPQTRTLCFLMKPDRICEGMMDGDVFVNCLIVVTCSVNSETGATTLEVILTE